MDLRARLGIAGALALAPLLPLTARLAHLQVMEHESLEARAAAEFERELDSIPPRAPILDRKGHILAQSFPSWDCFLDKKGIKNGRKLSQRLSGILEMPASEIRKKVLKGRRRRHIWLKKGLSYAQASKLNSLRPEGVGVVANQERLYPNGDLANSLLGKVGRDGQGLSGFELTFNKQLKGQAGKLDIIRDGNGRRIYDGVKSQAKAPKPLKLTIDRSFQYYTEAILKESADLYGVRRGIVAVQDPKTGEILALANYPPTPLRNHAIQDSFEPGSTIKIVAATAALEDSVISTTDLIDCEGGKYEISPRIVIHDHIPSGQLTLSEIFINSSNIGIAKIAEKVGPMRFYRYTQAFGLVNKTGIRLPGETAGMLKPVSDMTKVTLAAASYGYGIGVNALQILGAYSAIANGGILYQPKLVDDGKKPTRVRRIASKKTFAILAEMLESVVERGTGVPAQIAGYRVAGKTGTTRKLDPITHKYSRKKYVASFVGFVPASDPRLTILVILDEPQGAFYGSQVAAPIFAKVGTRLLALMGTPPDAKTRLVAKAADAPRLAKNNKTPADRTP